jgi:hypothetical protein
LVFFIVIFAFVDNDDMGRVLKLGWLNELRLEMPNYFEFFEIAAFFMFMAAVMVVIADPPDSPQSEAGGVIENECIVLVNVKTGSCYMAVRRDDGKEILVGGPIIFGHQYKSGDRVVVLKSKSLLWQRDRYAVRPVKP